MLGGMLPAKFLENCLIDLPLHAEILGHLKTINFPFGTNGKLMASGVLILKHFTLDF